MGNSSVARYTWDAGSSLRIREDFSTLKNISNHINYEVNNSTSTFLVILFTTLDEKHMSVITVVRVGRFKGAIVIGDFNHD